DPFAGEAEGADSGAALDVEPTSETGTAALDAGAALGPLAGVSSPGRPTEITGWAMTPPGSLRPDRASYGPAHASGSGRLRLVGTSRGRGSRSGGGPGARSPEPGTPNGADS